LSPNFALSSQASISHKDARLSQLSNARLCAGSDLDSSLETMREVKKILGLWVIVCLMNATVVF